MTHEIAGFLPAQRRHAKHIYCLKRSSKARVKSRIFTRYSGPCYTGYHTPGHMLYQSSWHKGNPNATHLLTIAYTGWQSLSPSFKKSEKKFCKELVQSFRFLSLSGTNEKRDNRCQGLYAVSLEMAYSLTPYLITLQNEAL
jgi:hypothetical protein